MAGRRRTTRAWLKGIGTVAAVLSLTGNFGVVDLVDGFTGFVDQARNQVLDVGWGAVFGVILPLGLLSQLRRPERRIAGIQQTGIVAAALAVAGAAGGEWGYLALAGGLGVVGAALVALHPARGELLTAGPRPDAALLAAAAVGAIPCLVYVWRMASAQRRDLPPADAVSNGLHHWTVMAALALVVVLLVLLAAAGTAGRLIPLVSACVAAAAWSISCLLAPPSAPGSEGHVWAAVALAWAAVTLGLGLRPRAAEEPLPAGALAPGR